MNSLDDEIRICPMCGNKTLWGEMIWLNGKCTCPSCYRLHGKRALKTKQLMNDLLEEDDLDVKG